MVIFFNFSLTSNHLHPLQVENCDSNSRLLVDENDNGKFRLERVKRVKEFVITLFTLLFKDFILNNPFNSTVLHYIDVSWKLSQIKYTVSAIYQ